MKSALALALGLATSAAVLAQQTPAQHQHPSGGKLGTVHFATSCATAAQAPFTHAMTLLHSFEFGQAIDAFNAALAADPSCGIAWWGVAMSRWGNPFSAAQRAAPLLTQGLDAVHRAQQAGAKTERERAYIAAAAILYTNYETTDQRILGKVDDPHRPLAELANDFVAAQLQAGLVSRGRGRSMNRQ